MQTYFQTSTLPSGIGNEPAGPSRNPDAREDSAGTPASAEGTATGGHGSWAGQLWKTRITPMVLQEKIFKRCVFFLLKLPDLDQIDIWGCFQLNSIFKTRIEIQAKQSFNSLAVIHASSLVGCLILGHSPELLNFNQ